MRGGILFRCTCVLGALDGQKRTIARRHPSSKGIGFALEAFMRRKML